MEAALRKVLTKPEVRDAITKMPILTPRFVPGQQMEKSLRGDIAYWGGVIKASGSACPTAVQAGGRPETDWSC